MGIGTLGLPPGRRRRRRRAPGGCEGLQGPPGLPLGDLQPPTLAPRCKSHQWRLPLFFLLQHDEGSQEELVCALACGRSLGAGCPG